MSKTVEKLNLYLVNLNVLYRKVQNYHWNVAGKGFFTIHSKLEEFYNDLNGQIDDVAERQYCTLKDYLALTTIKEAENKEIGVHEVLVSVKAEFEAMLNLVKEIKVAADEENDYGTSAMVDEYISNYEKNLWMLNAYLKEI